MLLDIRDFKGRIPKLSDTELPDNAAVTAANVTFKTGGMKPLAGTAAVSATLKNGTNTSIYKYRNGGNSYWLSWLGAVVNVVPSPVSLDTYNRLYWTGDGTPKMGTAASILTGGTTYPMASYRLGLPQPTVKLVPTLNGAIPSTATNLYIPENGALTVAASNVTVHGNTGTEVVDVPVGYSGVTVMATVDRIVLHDHIADFKMKAVGNVLRIYDTAGTTLLVSYILSDALAANRITFVDGTAVAAVTGLNAITLGGVAVNTSTPTAVSSPTIFDTALTTTEGVGSADSLPTIARSYAYSFLSAYGEEGPLSDPSDVIYVYQGSAISLGTVPAAPTDGKSPVDTYNITQIRIYRTNTGSNGTQYQHVKDVAVGATGVLDELLDEQLGEVCPSANWFMPPDDLQGLICLPCGSLCGFRGKDLFFSVPYLPHAWDYNWIMSFPAEIEGIGSYGSSILVATTEGAPYVVTGNDPSSMTSERLEIGNGCLASRGMVDTGYSIIYPSVDGLMSVGVGGVSLLTDKLMNRSEWNSLFSSTFIGFYYDRQYVCFTSSGNYVFDPQTLDLASFTLAGNPTIAGGWTDPADGALYLSTGSAIVQWEAGSALTMSWKSKIFTAPYPLCFSALQVFADAYPVTVTSLAYLPDATVQTLVAERSSIFTRPASGILSYAISVSSTAPVRLPGGFTTDKWQFSLSSSSKITRILVANSLQELNI